MEHPYDSDMDDKENGSEEDANDQNMRAIRDVTFQSNEDKMDIEETPEDPSDKPNNKLKENPIEEDDDDKYKPEGVVTLEIDRFGEFMGEGPTDQLQRLSQPVHIRGLPWKILAIPRDQGRPPMERRHFPVGKALGFFLQCNGDVPDPSWSCTASAVLRVHSQTPTIEDYTRRISHTFYAKENDWGYSQFMVCDTLADPTNGYIKNDTIKLSVQVWADAPHGVHWDSKKHAGYIGLKNQGATCYMNSILQTLFFTNKLRKAVYQMPTEHDDPESSVALAMQRVFYELQFSSTPVGTKKLTKSFGWDSVDSFLQHDVQELCRVLLDNLESKMKSTKVADTIPQLFRGRMKSYIRCKNVDFESSREESFYDVQLNVKGKANIIESFRDYTQPELLDGDNKYDAGVHGLQAAEKGVKFLSFPPILHLQLMRFQYDPTIDANVKINDKFEFPDTLVLNEFIDEHGEKDDYTYLLHAVLVHSGDFHGGHYVVFINTNLKGNPRWCKFDDDVVSRAAYRDAVTANYGGDDPEIGTRSYSNAYMLVYIKKSEISDVLNPVTEEDIPEHLKARFESEKSRDEQRRREKEEATLFIEIALITEEIMHNHHGYDLFDQKVLEDHSLRMKVQKNMNVNELHEFIGKNMSLRDMDFRLWLFQDINQKRDGIRTPALESYRPASLIKRNVDMSHKIDRVENLFDSDCQLLFIELDKSTSSFRDRLPVYRDDLDVLFFLKYYNHERKLTEYKGSIFLSIEEDIQRYGPQILKKVGLPENTKVNFYVELSPEHVYKIQNPSATIREDRNLLLDGLILVVEEQQKVTADNCIQSYYEDMYTRIQVEVITNADGFGTSMNTPSPPFKGNISLRWKMDKVCDWAGKQIDYDPLKILLWRVCQHNEKPTLYLSKENYAAYSVRELLGLTGNSIHDPRTNKCYKLYYTKLPIPFSELEFRKNFRLQIMNDKFQVTDITVFVEKTGTIRELLTEARKEFKFSENGTGRLRCVHVGLSANCLRVFQIFPEDMAISEFQNKYGVSPSMNARVEEIPSDQLDVRQPDEHLLPVAHYDKEISRMFGVPFYIKIRNNESFANIRRRIKEMLEVSDREFEKYKFSLVTSNRIIREIDNDDKSCVNLNELLHNVTTFASQPYLGIDHMNKSRGARTGANTEKPIIIHN